MHEGRLARARGAHDGGEAAGVEVDVDAVEGADLGVALAVDLGGPDGRARVPAGWSVASTLGWAGASTVEWS